MNILAYGQRFYLFIITILVFTTRQGPLNPPSEIQSEWVRTEYRFRDPLVDCEFLDETDGWVSAMANRTELFHWDGKNWTGFIVDSPYHLWKVSLLTPNWGWGIGMNKTFMFWDGKTWEGLPLQSDYMFDLNDIFFLNEKQGWAVGKFDDQTENASVISDVRLQWDGSKWTQFYEVYGSIFGTDAMIVFPESGIWTAEINEVNFFEGLDWGSKQEPVSYEVDLFYPNSFSGVSANDIWLVGSNRGERGTVTGALFHWDGKTWEKVLDTEQSMLSVDMFNKNFGIMVANQRLPNSEKQEGAIYQWDGQSWSIERSGEPYTFYDVCVLQNSFWVVGINEQNQGVAIRYTQSERSTPSATSQGAVVTATITPKAGLSSPTSTIVSETRTNTPEPTMVVLPSGDRVVYRPARTFVIIMLGVVVSCVVIWGTVKWLGKRKRRQ